MKKFIGFTGAFVAVITLFSFSTAEAKRANYNELEGLTSAKEMAVGNFTRYQTSSVTAGETTWNYRREVWSLTDSNITLNQIEETLK